MTKQQEDWEIELEKQLPDMSVIDGITANGSVDGRNAKPELVDFIKDLLKKEREKIADEMKKLRPIAPHTVKNESEESMIYWNAYLEGYQDAELVVSKLKNNEKTTNKKS